MVTETLAIYQQMYEERQAENAPVEEPKKKRLENQPRDKKRVEKPVASKTNIKKIALEQKAVEKQI
jgi:hypothetical protein